MTEQTTIDLAQQAITMTLLIAAPVLIVGLAVALVVGRISRWS